MSRADSSVPNILDGLAKVTSGNPHQVSSSSSLYNFVESYPMFRVPVEQERLISCNSNGQSKSVIKSVTQQLCTEPNKGAGHKPGLQPNSGHPLPSLPFKRKVITECTQDYQGHQTMSAPNKRVGQATAFSASQISAPKSFPKPSASGRKVVQIEPVTNESRSNATKKAVQPQVSPKGKSEVHETVRSKLRESLASALALVSQEKEGYTDGKMKLQNEAGADIQVGLREHKPCPSSNGTALLESPKDGKSHLSNIPSSSGECNVDDKTSLSFQSKEIFKEASQTESFLGTDFECNSVLPGDDSLFNSGLYFKDEFLQGNGLTWESDLNLHIPKVKETENVVKPVPMNEDPSSDVDRKVIRSPDSIAFAIELELFKLFGCVNKKYKEKGRSLLFNLKDRNNPELRERVMSGELPPDRLCSMTAEELASKELSQWRIAKAEEFDHLKVLPETDINMRRLVKKNHKGEYQVDFEPNSGAVEETPLDISAVSPSKRQKIDRSDGSVPPKAEQTKGDDCEITLPSDGADMQGLMGDDLNDLPPVISLDEFMESLNKDPPFENLPADSMTTRSESNKENVEVGSKSLSPVESQQQKMSSDKVEVKKESPKTDVDKNLTGTPKYHVRKMSSDKVEVKMESPKIVGDKNVSGTLKPSDNYSVAQLPKRECVWEGQLQLNLSSMAYFMALYISGEKASSREWARFVDIKGRVRYDAFDKFLQALPMSRSRAIMVCHFVLKEGFTDSERASLKELVDSYIADERLGFAEPGHGVELYFCAPRSKSVDMIVNRLPKSYTDKLNEIDDGLIAIVVWRKVQITSSAVSPISSSKEQPVIKKQIGRQYVDNNDMNRNNVFAPELASSPPPILSVSQSTVGEDDGDDDDAPPGFGPPGSRDDDDLPEFQFSGGSHPSMPSLPNPNPVLGREPSFQNPPHRPSSVQAAQMRELIQKYGQNGNNTAGSGIATNSWNDDDDDIPEWQPQPVHNPALPTHIVNHQQPHMANPQMVQCQQWPPVMQPSQSLQPLQPPMAVQQQRAWGLYGPESVGGLATGQFLGSPGPGPGHSPRDWRSNGYRK